MRKSGKVYVKFERTRPGGVRRTGQSVTPEGSARGRAPPRPGQGHVEPRTPRVRSRAGLNWPQTRRDDLREAA